MNEQTINKMLKDAKISGIADEWKGRRIYINLSSCDKRWHGDRTYQLYYDLFSDTLVSKENKGFHSSAFLDDVQRVENLFIKQKINETDNTLLILNDDYMTLNLDELRLSYKKLQDAYKILKKECDDLQSDYDYLQEEYRCLENAY